LSIQDLDNFKVGSFSKAWMVARTNKLICLGENGWMPDSGMGYIPWRLFSNGGFQQPVGQPDSGRQVFCSRKKPANLRRLPPRCPPDFGRDETFEAVKNRTIEDKWTTWTGGEIVADRTNKANKTAPPDFTAFYGRCRPEHFE